MISTMNTYTFFPEQFFELFQTTEVTQLAAKMIIKIYFCQLFPIH